MMTPIFRITWCTLTTLLLAFSARAQEADQNWPQGRGPQANGVAPAADPPKEWSETKNVKWKVKLPGEGNSSPIVWGDRVYLQAAINTGKKGAAAAAPPAPVVPDAGRRPGGRGGPGGFGGGAAPTE